LSSIHTNASPKRVQLSLDNFFHRSRAKRKRKEPSSPHETFCDEPPQAVPSASPDYFDSDLDIFDLEDSRPTKKARSLIRVSETKVKASRPQVQRKLGTSAPRSSRQAADQSDLQPLSSIPKMFDDLVSRAGKLDRVVNRLNGRKLRVATMCSGTESPLLALRMITRSLFKETGKTLEVEHIFSCEIEPFKQAYIERNFSPPILFRDVLELANDYA
jgi:hypothetical protein